jgi:hypothetical protein
MTNRVVLLLIGAEAEGSAIPEAVPIEGLAPETHGAAGGAPELMEVAGGEAPAVAEGERDDVLPESTLEVVVRSPEIQDAEPIRSAPMSEAATSSRGGIELLADDLVDSAAVERHLKALQQAEQWMKVTDQHPLSSQSFSVEYPNDILLSAAGCHGDMLQGYGDTVLRAEAFEEQLVKSRKHAVMLQSKLDGTFAQYHNEVQDM